MLLIRRAETMTIPITIKLRPGLLASVFAAAVTCAPATAQQQQKTNIVIIWGDDIGPIQCQRLLTRRNGLHDA